jgi:putative peptidoglycan lipid II flippase
MIVAMVVLWPLLPRLGLHPGLALPIGAVLGGSMQLLVQLPALRREGFRFSPELAPADPALRRIARLMLPAIFGLAATQINILVDTVLASWYEGAITWLSLAFRMMQLPLGLFGVAIGTANLARVSMDAARGDVSGMRASLASALRASALLTLPATAGLVVLSRPIVRLIFEHGRFTAEDTAKTGAAVVCYALGLYAYSLTKTQVPTFYALGDTRTPVVASGVAVGSKIVTSFVLIWALPGLGVDAFLGLALSTSLAAWVNFVWLARILRRRVGRSPEQRVVAETFRLGLLSAIMGTCCAILHGALERFFPGGAFAGEALRLAVTILVGFGIVAAGAVALDVPEARRLVERFNR